MSEIETLDDIVERLCNLGHEVERRDARIGVECEWPTERPFRFYPLPNVQVTVTCVRIWPMLRYRVEHRSTADGWAMDDTSSYLPNVAWRLFNALEGLEETATWLGRWR